MPMPLYRNVAKAKELLMKPVLNKLRHLAWSSPLLARLFWTATVRAIEKPTIILEFTCVAQRLGYTTGLA
jgi:hypothetical protein